MYKKPYVTTAIPYVNGAPHIGHALDYLLADVYVRYEKEGSVDVRFQAGTDEHGNKIFDKAKASGVPIEQYITENSNKFRSFISKLGVEPTDFIRTSNPEHERRVQKIWHLLEDHIYPADYEGWYCSGCESFITEKEYDENGGVCPDHQKPYERLSEKNYYFRISDFKDEIARAIKTDTLKILPESRKNQVLNLLADSPDVSISRPKKNLSWGIPVPEDDSQVMYVWLDALSNYLTVLGFPDSGISEYWPADLQIVGKDILRFHAIIWPAMLLALKLPLPKVILSHGYVLANGQKMSKSIGNVIDPLEILNKYGLDPFRYYFLRHIDTFNDSDFTWDKFNAAYSGELANDLGNLVQRLAVLSNKNSVSLTELPLNPLCAFEAHASDDVNQMLKPEFQKPVNPFYYFDEYYCHMKNFEFSKAFDTTWSKIQELNKEINDKAPWSVAKTDPETAKKILEELDRKLIICAYLLKPFLPTTAERIIKIFSASAIVPPKPLFPKQ